MSNLVGFTLFKVAKGWQMSLKRDGEEGWSVHIISDRFAERILARLQDRIRYEEAQKRRVLVDA